MIKHIEFIAEEEFELPELPNPHPYDDYIETKEIYNDLEEKKEAELRRGLISLYM